MANSPAEDELQAGTVGGACPVRGGNNEHERPHPTQHENQEQAASSPWQHWRTASIQQPRGRSQAGQRRKDERTGLSEGDSGRNPQGVHQAQTVWACSQDPSESRRAGKKDANGRMSSQRNSSSSICSRKIMPANGRHDGQSLRLERCDPDPWTQFPPDQRGTGSSGARRGPPGRLPTHHRSERTPRPDHHHAATRSGHRAPSFAAPVI